MALLPRDRRDTPAQDKEARRRASDRALEIASSGTRRDTPAQQRNLNRQQTPAQGRTVGRERIDREYQRADEVGRQQAANPPPGSLRAGVNRATSALRSILPRPEPGDTAGMRQNFTPDDTGPDQLMPALRRVGGFVADEAQNNASEWLLARPAPLGQMSRWLGNRINDAGLLPEMGGGSQGQSATRGPGGVMNPAGGSGAMDMARGLASGQGYAIGPDGRTTFYEGTQRNSGPGNLSVMGNMGAAADEFARANAIRQQTIDSQRPQNQVTVLPNTSGTGSGASQASGADQQIQRLLRDYSSTRDPWGKAAIRSQIEQLQAVADRNAGQQDGAADRQNTLQAQQLRNQGALATTLAGSRGGSNPYDMARAEQTMLETQQMQNPLPTEPPVFDADQLAVIGTMDASVRGPLMTDMLNNYQRQQAGYQLNQYLQGESGATFDDLRAAYADGELAGTYLEPLMDQYLSGRGQQETENMAAGGLVPEMSAIGFAQGGMVPEQYGAQMGPGMDMGSAMGMAAPGSGGIDMLQMEYDQYAQGAQQLGVPAIPFEEYVSLKQQSIPQAQAAPGAAQPMTGAMQGSAMSFAQGGMVPPGMDPTDTSGKMIVDPNPDAPQDSIPALIDGHRPAKLDSGEFVIPKHVVMWHGMDKLNKLIEQAEQKGQGNGTQPGSAPASPSATGAARQ